MSRFQKGCVKVWRRTLECADRGSRRPHSAPISSLKSSLIKADVVVQSSKREIDLLSVDTLRLYERSIGGVGSPRRIRYGFINEQQAAVAVAIAYLVVSIWKGWEQERERARWRKIERWSRTAPHTQGKGDGRWKIKKTWEGLRREGGAARSRVSAGAE